MPNSQALQVFYGTVPLILIIFGVWMREQMLLKDMLSRLGRIEDRLLTIETRITGVEKKVEALELKAWR